MSGRPLVVETIAGNERLSPKNTENLTNVVRSFWRLKVMKNKYRMARKQIFPLRWPNSLRLEGARTMFSRRRRELFGACDQHLLKGWLAYGLRHNSSDFKLEEPN